MHALLYFPKPFVRLICIPNAEPLNLKQDFLTQIYLVQQGFNFRDQQDIERSNLTALFFSVLLTTLEIHKTHYFRIVLFNASL